MRASRLAAAFALSAVFLAVQVPAHEYVHCVAYWARGGQTCYVRFAAPGQSLPSEQGAAVGAIGQAFVGEAPWWEHPVMYAGHFLATAAFGFWLGHWLARPSLAPAAARRAESRNSALDASAAAPWRAASLAELWRRVTRRIT